MGGDELIVFDELYHDELVEAYAQKFGEVPDCESDRWNDFVAEEYTDWFAGQEDRLYDEVMGK